MLPRRAPAAGRFAWVDFAKGFCIVAVVAMWVAGEMQGYQPHGQAGWLGYFVSFAHPFRMPDFFLISGLFLSRVIDRPWKHYLDTKVVHYLYFLVLWTLIIVPATWALGSAPSGTTVPPNLHVAAKELLLYLVYEPFQNLWFVMFLPIYFVATRLLRHVPVAAVVAIGAVLMIFPLHTGFYPVDRFGVYFLYFYAGHAFASRFFALADWAPAHRSASVAGLLVWAAFNAMAVKLQWTEHLAVLTALGFLGISAVVVFSSLLSRHRAAAGLLYLGQNSIVVYLGFYLPMVIVVPALKASAVGSNLHLVGTLAVAACIGISVAWFHLSRLVGLSFLFERPAWARLNTTPRHSPHDLPVPSRFPIPTDPPLGH
jgi:uncharacterized membrane protein YcfT